MQFVKNFYSKDYSFEKHLFDDISKYIETYGSDWLSHRIELCYRQGCLVSAHLFMQYKRGLATIKTQASEKS